MWNKAGAHRVIQTSLAMMMPIFGICAGPIYTLSAEAIRNDQISLPMPTKGEIAKRIALFEPMEYLDTQDHADCIYRYRLFIPTHIDRNKSYPLLVWLHGFGQSGDDNWQQLAHIQDEVARWEEQKGGFPCFVLVPQNPHKDRWRGQVLSVVLRLLKRTIGDAPIDEDRIYLAGVSVGGGACWTLGARHSEIFAALSPMASAGTTGQLEPLKAIPIWAYHSAADSATPPDAVRTTVAAVQRLGGPCWLTEIPTYNHDCWTAAFREYEVIEWLLQQRRGSPPVPVPAWAKWKNFRKQYLIWSEVWPRLVVAGVLIACVIIVRRTRCAAKATMKSSGQGTAQCDRNAGFHDR